MSTAKKGDKVKVHYTGRLKDGTVFDSSEGRDPLEFEVGAGMMIKGFDSAVDGMTVGQKVSVDIEVNEAYGPVREEMYIDVPKEQLPADLQPAVGQQLSMTQPNGQPVPVMVKEVKDTSIVLDANHPLAGKDLVFDIELVAIN
ncbi:MAG: peptidylprolyl isomerase [Bacteroidota bacterium]